MTRHRQPLTPARRAALLAFGLTAGIGMLHLSPISEAAAQERTAAKPAARQQAAPRKPVAKPTAARPAAKAAPAAAASAAGASTADGRQVYATTCVACHQATGEGMPEVYPPLAGSEWVTGDEGNVVRIILHGMTGPIEVQGESYQGVMPPWGGVLKDADVAAVATYIRGNWGNKASPVTTATVARIRAASPARTTPWTAPELAKLAVKK